MSKGLYITGTEPKSGKSVVALGLMEMLSGHGRKTGFFRPIIYPGENGDSLINLLSTRHAIEGAANGKLSHGQAVAIGTAAAAKISLILKRLSENNLYDLTSHSTVIIDQDFSHFRS